MSIKFSGPDNLEDAIKKAGLDAAKQEASSKLYNVSCPHCSEEIEVPLGLSICPKCGEKINLNLNFNF